MIRSIVWPSNRSIRRGEPGADQHAAPVAADGRVVVVPAGQAGADLALEAVAQRPDP